VTSVLRFQLSQAFLRFPAGGGFSITLRNGLITLRDSSVTFGLRGLTQFPLKIGGVR
jgi:hypothetical protein